MTGRATRKAKAPSDDYGAFLASKSQLGSACGFEPTWLPDCLMDFQRALSVWEVRTGRSATFADCGLGKTLLALVRAENVVRHANGRVLILTPLAVAPQFVAEGVKFGVGVTHSRDGKVGGPGVYVTNYERLHLFDPADFACLIADESGGIKDFDSKRSGAVVEFMRTLPYRGLYTATAAPNDFVELGTSSEALGGLGYMDMLSRFFASDDGSLHPYRRDLFTHRAKGRLWHFKPHGDRDFWRWVCGWARACRRPSDLGFEDGRFVLPPLTVREHVVPARTARPGYLFDPGAVTLSEQREVRRRTLSERCEKVAGLVADADRAVSWCHLNDEGDMLEDLIPGSVQVSGRDPDDEKEEKLAAFGRGEVRVLVSKPEICGYGLNWQHCARMTFFPSHSFERYYQAVRRSWRFGQTREVVVDLVLAEGEERVKANLERKSRQADEMYDRLVSLMNEGLLVARPAYGDEATEVPSWLS